MIYRILATVLVCILLTLIFWYQKNALFYIDSDEGITGLMAIHILQGRQIPFFYYGQNYIGPLEAILASFYMSFLGVNALALKLAPITFSILAIIFGYLSIKKLFGNRVALYFLVLMCVPGHFLIEWYSKARGNFSYVTLVTALTAYWLTSSTAKSYFFLGTFLGLSWWMNGQVTSVLCAALVASGRFFMPFIIGVGLGFTPILVKNFTTNFATFEELGRAQTTFFWLNLEGLYFNFLPILFGLRRIFDTSQSWSLFSLFLSLGAMFFTIIFSRGLPNQEFRYILFHVINTFTFVGLFLLSEFGLWNVEPRYGMSVVFSLTFILAFSLSRLNLMAGIALLVALVYARLNTMFVEYRLRPTGTAFLGAEARSPRDIGKVILELKKRSINLIRTPYWNAYNLAFVSGEDIQTELVREPLTPRIHYVKNRDLLEVPVLDHETFSSYYRNLATLSRLEVTEEPLIFGLKLFWFRRLPFKYLNEFELRSSFRPDLLLRLRDNDLSTFWITGKVIESDTILKISSKNCVRGIRFCTGPYLQDIPTSLKIKIKSEIHSVSEDWLNFFKSSRCLEYFFENPYSGTFEVQASNQSNRRYFVSFSEVVPIACD
ncbi:MAG: hypothetical protein NZO16_01450 [Deltaproteobacteria bacterium]|nr:hypothetical protein [Deltaproteobacteria bacterium]